MAPKGKKRKKHLQAKNSVPKREQQRVKVLSCQTGQGPLGKKKSRGLGRGEVKNKFRKREGEFLELVRGCNSER